MFHTSRPLTSQIIDRSHLEALKYKDMVAYINHHLKIAGVNEQVFSCEATLAILRDPVACSAVQSSSPKAHLRDRRQ